jgi:hypothetical protein
MIWMLLAGFARAQRLPDGEIPPPPPSGLSDENGVLSKTSGAQARVTGMLQELESRYGFRFLVVLERSLISTNASDLASQYQQEWLPDGGGIVIVYESDTRNMGFGRELEADEGMQSDNIGVPAYSMVEIISSALYVVETDATPEVYIENLIAKICANMTDYFERKKAPTAKGNSLRLALITVGALSLLALCGMGIGWLIGRSEKKQYESRVFPAVDMPERLGASYGGGCSSTNYFGISRNK